MPRALLSVYNKTGIEELARGLVASGWSIISSGGPAKALVAAGISVTDVADLTGVPAILDHRVVTLHPKVHGGILADTALPHHVSDMAEYGIEAIDNPELESYSINASTTLQLNYKPNLLNGINTITGVAKTANNKMVNFTAIPFYSIGNRNMSSPYKVWMLNQK